MPKPTKLHSKGKPTSIQKPCKEVNSEDASDPDETMRQFQLELCWCIQQLERTLADNKGNEKQMTEAWKVLTVLKNNNQPIIRKRQLMRTQFGDYRAKMAAEEKKLVKMANKIKITESPAQPKATFLRKSAFLSTGDSSFRFNFHLVPEPVDHGNTTSTNNGNTDSVTNAVNTSPETNAIIESVAVRDNNVINNSENKFKFTFSGSEFKFNFDVNNS